LVPHHWLRVQGEGRAGVTGWANESMVAQRAIANGQTNTVATVH